MNADGTAQRWRGDPVETTGYDGMAKPQVLYTQLYQMWEPWLRWPPEDSCTIHCFHCLDKASEYEAYKAKKNLPKSDPLWPSSLWDSLGLNKINLSTGGGQKGSVWG